MVVNYKAPVWGRQMEAIKLYKETHPCMDCGIKYPSYVMHFDHARGKKLFSIGKHLEHSWDDVEEELSKCDLVCANCHAIRTHKRRATHAN